VETHFVKLEDEPNSTTVLFLVKPELVHLLWGSVLWEPDLNQLQFCARVRLYTQDKLALDSV